MKIKTQKGIWVSSSFNEKFGNEDIKPAKTVPAFKTLTKNMYDSEIKSELGIEECTLEDVAAFLKNPPEGTNDGYTNLFYVAGCVVRVYWFSDDREWSVHAWGLDGGHWSAGNRAFGCNVPQNLSPESDALSLGLLARVEKLEAIVKHHNLTTPS